MPLRCTYVVSFPFPFPFPFFCDILFVFEDEEDVFFYACLKAASDAAGVSLSILPRHACANSYKAEAGPVPRNQVYSLMRWPDVRYAYMYHFFALLKATNTGLIAGWTLGPFLSSLPSRNCSTLEGFRAYLSALPPHPRLLREPKMAQCSISLLLSASKITT